MPHLHQVAVADTELVLDLPDAADQPLPHGLVVIPLHRLGTVPPGLENRAEPLFVSERIRAVRLDHQAVTLIPRELVLREVGMNRLGDVAKQSPHRVGGEPRRRLVERIAWRRRRAAAVFHQLGELAQFGFGDGALELFELLVEVADLAAITQPERGEIGRRLRDLAGTSREDGLERVEASAQCAQVVAGLPGWDERHPQMISNGNCEMIARPHAGAGTTEMTSLRSALFLVVGILIGAGAQSVLGQPREIVALNHVAIAVPDYDRASAFYGGVMGFQRAFALKQPDGSPYLSYFQVNSSTFIEVMAVTPQRPAGFVHFGLEVSDVDAVVRRLRAAGITVGDASVSAQTKSRIAVAHTPDGTTFELLEFGPDSLQRKAMNSWR